MKTTLSLFFLFFIFNSRAQTEYGIKAGINHSSILYYTELESENPDYKTSFHLGLFSKIAISESLFISPELLYSRKGPDGINIDYLDIPILLEYQISDKISVSFGPELSYLVSAKFKNQNSIYHANEFWDNKYDIGLGIGTTYNINDQFKIGFRYTHGFRSVMTDNEIQIIDHVTNQSTLSDISTLNSVFQLSLYHTL